MNNEKTIHRLLVVDDNPAIHEDFRKILGRGPGPLNGDMQNLEAELFGAKSDERFAPNFEMDSAFQGQEALDKVKAAAAEGRPYSLAFMDVRMPPGWDGIETIAHIWKEHPQIQIVICTAYSDYSWEDILQKLGESDSVVILKKPFDNIEVLQLAHALTKKWTVTRQANARMSDLDEMVRKRTSELLEANHKLQCELNRRALIESALRESEERFHKAFEAASVALTIIRADNECYVDVNESFTKLVGQQKEALVGRTAQELALLDKPEQIHQIVETVNAGNKVANLAVDIRHQSGELRHALVSVEPLLLGDLPCLLFALLDVSEQRRLEGQLRQSQKMEAIGQLAAGVAHDFNNLLTVIQGHASIQLAKANLEGGIAKSLEQVKLASERAAALTRQLLAFSRKQVIHCKPLDLNAALSRLQDMLQRMMGETIQLDWHAFPGPAIVFADESNLEQVVMNLVLNARDAMPDGGIVTITAKVVEITAASAHHPEAPEGRHMVLTVTDIGCGMDAATLNRIFEPFFTTKSIGKGTGLGLATVYGIVKQHEGWIEVESAPGKGSTFRVFLPASKQRPDSSIQPTTSAEESRRMGSGETILVVEDEHAVREYVCSVLVSNGYVVLESSCGAEAMLTWQTAGKKIDLLFTDMVMPNGVSGSLLASRLIQRDPSLKVIYSSGYSPEVVAKGEHLDEGVNFLAKPFTQERLLGVVRRALDNTSQTVQLAEAVPA